MTIQTDSPATKQVYAFYSDQKAAYALLLDEEGFMVWRLRSRTWDSGINPFIKDIDYPHKQFRDIGSFVGYCKLKHYDICIG